MKRVLVTGATGFIGRHSLTPLIECGFEVHATYNDKPHDRPDVTWHRVDLLARDGVSVLLEEIRPTHLLHFAWYVHPDYKTSEKNLLWKDATLFLLQAFADSGGIRATLAGTCMEYEWADADVLDEATSPLNPATLYGQSKHDTHKAVEILARESGISFAWARIFNTYGPGDDDRRVVPQTIRALSEAMTPPIEDGGITLDYLYVKDVAAACVALLDSTVEGAVNIGSGFPLTLKNLALSIANINGQRELVTAIPDSVPDNQSRVVAQVIRLHDEVKWQSKYDLPRGLSETISWWKQH